MKKEEASEGATKEAEAKESNICEERLVDRAKSILVKGKAKALAFYSRHEKGIKRFAGGAVLAACSAYIAKQEYDKRVLQEENDALRDGLEIGCETSDGLARRVVDLEALSDEKDAWMDAVTSEDLRLGGSLGGQVLSSKREYLKNLDSD